MFGSWNRWKNGNSSTSSSSSSTSGTQQHQGTTATYTNNSSNAPSPKKGLSPSTSSTSLVTLLNAPLLGIERIGVMLKKFRKSSSKNGNGYGFLRNNYHVHNNRVKVEYSYHRGAFSVHGGGNGFFYNSFLNIPNLSVHGGLSSHGGSHHYTPKKNSNNVTSLKSNNITTIDTLGEDALGEIFNFLTMRDIAKLMETSVAINQMLGKVIQRRVDKQSANGLISMISHYGEASVIKGRLHLISLLENGYYSPTISCGDEHSALVSRYGKVFTWGLGATDGRLGHSVDYPSQSVPESVPSFPGFAVSVSCGMTHTVVLNKEGAAYTFGDGNVLPRKVVGSVDGKHISLIAAGSRFSAFVTREDNQIHIASALSMRDSLLGLDLSISSSPPYFSIAYSYVLTRGEISQEEKILQLSAGVSHLLILTDYGKVYACGNASFGQLGNGYPTFFVSSPKLVSGLDEKFIIHLSAGHFHSALVSLRGELFTFGCTFNGRLGFPVNSNVESILLPNRVELPAEAKRALFVAAGSKHTVVLTREGKIVSFGDSSFGQLANESYFFQSSNPRICSFPILAENDHYIQIAAGGQHSLAATDKGDYHIAGNALLLGQGPRILTSMEISGNPLREPRPRLVSFVDEPPSGVASQMSRHDVSSTNVDLRDEIPKEKNVGNDKKTSRKRRTKRAASI